MTQSIHSVFIMIPACVYILYVTSFFLFYFIFFSYKLKQNKYNKMKQQPNLERHLCIFIEDGHIKYQPSKQML